MSNGKSWTRFTLNALFNKDPSWIFDPTRDLESVKHGSLVYVRSRTHPDVFYVVDTTSGSCSCKAAEYDLRCWHVEAVDLGLYVESDTWPAWAYEMHAPPLEVPLH